MVTSDIANKKANLVPTFKYLEIKEIMFFLTGLISVTPVGDMASPHVGSKPG